MRLHVGIVSAGELSTSDVEVLTPTLADVNRVAFLELSCADVEGTSLRRLGWSF